MSSVVHYEGGVWRSDFFLNHLDWLRGCANLCLVEIRPAEVLLLQNWRKKLAFLPLHVRHPGEAFLDQVAMWNLYPSQKIYIKRWNRKKLALGMPLTSLTATSNITHSAIASQDSSRVTTTFNAHCTGHCTIEDFNVNFAYLKSKSVRYRTVLCAWYHVQEGNVPDHGPANGTGVHYKVVWARVRVLWTTMYLGIQEVVLLQKTMELHKPEWIFSTPFYTINPFGPSAGRISRCPRTTELLPAYDIRHNKRAWSWNHARLFSSLIGSNHDDGRVVCLKRGIQGTSCKWSSSASPVRSGHKPHACIACMHPMHECGTRKQYVAWKSDSSEKLPSVRGYCVEQLTTISSANCTLISNNIKKLQSILYRSHSQ